ncbi:PH-like domain-containing protein [Pedococcus sp. 2YAF34]|uniref:PH-like domain-containing protein n=1 Tax=Pedococcus sp. 2YAF34 TaxID=3233032 RepID=UPI003F95AA71
MTRLQAVGVLLVALGLIYGLLYVAWLRKQRRHTSAAVATETTRGDGGTQPDEVGPVGARLVVEGTYISTTTAVSRLERVTVEGLGNRARATLTVTRGNPDELVRIERQGESTVVVTAGRLVSVRRDRGMVGKFVGSNRVLVLQWRADDDALYETGFLPRYKADVERVESALWWHTGDTAARAQSSSERPSGETWPGAATPTPPVTDSPATEGKSAS